MIRMLIFCAGGICGEVHEMQLLVNGVSMMDGLIRYSGIYLCIYF